MSQGQPAENQWEEIGDEVPQQNQQVEEEHHHELPQEHQGAEADQWQELGDDEPQQAEDAEPTPQEEYPEETSSHHPHQSEEPSEESRNHHEAPEHQQLRAYHEEESQEAALPEEERTEQDDEGPALHAHDHEDATEPSGNADETHHQTENDYPTEEPHHEHHLHGEDVQDVQDEEASAQPAEQWDELDDKPHEHHQPLRSYHEEDPQEYAPQVEQEDEAPALRADDHEEAVEPAAHSHENQHHPHPHLHAHDEEEPAQHHQHHDEEPEEEHHHPHEEEEPHHHQPLRSYHEEPVQQPAQADQWAEIGDEEQQEQHHEGHPQHPAEDAEAPVETAYEEEEPSHQARSMPPPEHDRRQLGGIVKPKTRNVKGVARWEPVEHQPREESDDEFELSTCMAPVYEGEGEAGSEDTSVFKNGEPDCQGEIMSCFDEPNLLYRIIDPKEKTWAFYNDSLNYEMHVQFTFGKHSKLQPLENTVMKQNDEGQYVTEVVVYPTETEMFVQGSVNGFTSKLRAVPLSDEYHNARRGITEEQVASETAAIQQLTDSDNAEDVLQACIENGIAFVDPEFPPCQASLETGATKPFKPLAWARPQACVPEEMASQVRLFRSNVRPGCVDAGDLGDSWVMCSVAAVSEDPARLMGMFRHPEGKAAAQREHAVGAYRVTFNKNGWWRSVLVDSYLPVSAGKIKYAKSAVDPAEIWPAIMEKAYAKLHGSYAKICSGDPLHALQDMTGFSTTRFDEALGHEKDSVRLFDDLVRGISAGYTVICSTPGRGPNDKDQELSERYAEVGLVTGHAYTILDAKFIERENLRIVKVRNAWGRGVEWNGDWSDNDSKWEEYPEVAEACDFQKAADGTFWMPWEAAQKYFNGGGVCFSHQPAYDYRMNSVFTNGVPSAVLEIEVATPTWFTFVISQDDKRCQENVTEYQPVMISIAEPVDGGMYKVVMNSSANGARPSSDKWTFLQARDISLIHKLDAGKYIIVPRIMPSERQADQIPYVLGMISNKEVGSGDVSVKFKRLDASNRVFENFPKFEPELKEVEQPVQFQKRAPGEGFPLTQMGEELA